MRLRKIVSALCLTVLLSLVVACKSAGSEYLGKWIIKGTTDTSKAIDIQKNGSSFILAGPDSKLPAELDKDSNSLKAGFMTLSYVKASDSILVSDGSELQRVK
jgi:hypothetical protein